MNSKLILVLAAFVAVAYFIFTGQKQEADRAAALPSIAGDMGLEYAKSGSAGSLTSTSFPIFNIGEDVKIENVMQGKSGEVDVKIFDVDYRTVQPVNEIAGNENPNRTQQTVVLVRGDAALPNFVLRPNTVAEQWIKFYVGEGVGLVKDKAGDRIELAADQLSKLNEQVRGYTNRLDPRVSSVFGDIADFVATPTLTDINFDANASFSGQYLLTGADEVSIRQAFKPAVMDHLVGLSPGVSVEARGSELIAYRTGMRTSVADMQSFISQIKTLYALLKN